MLVSPKLALPPQKNLNYNPAISNIIKNILELYRAFKNLSRENEKKIVSFSLFIFLNITYKNNIGLTIIRADVHRLEKKKDMRKVNDSGNFYARR